VVWCHDNGCPIDVDICAEVAEDMRHFEVLHYIRSLPRDTAKSVPPIAGTHETPAA